MSTIQRYHHTALIRAHRVICRQSCAANTARPCALKKNPTASIAARHFKHLEDQTMRLLQITGSMPLTTEVCCACGCLFAMPTDMQQRRVEDHKSFYCPNGHPQQYTGEREAQRLQRELNAAIQSRDAARSSRDYAQKEADHFRKARDGMKGQLVLTKKRISNGVCPCCNRTFKDLAQHMENKHPNYATPSCPPTIPST